MSGCIKCGRELYDGSCKICDRDETPARKAGSQHWTVANQQLQNNSIHNQQSVGSQGQRFDPNVRHIDDDGPAYHQTSGEQIGKVIGPLIGVVVVMGIAAFIIVQFAMARAVGESVVETAKAKTEQTSSSSQSSSTTPAPQKTVIDYSKVRMSVRADPRLRDSGGLALKPGKSGIIYIKVKHLEEDEYYTKWTLIKPELIGIVVWNQVDKNTISVSVTIDYLPMYAYSNKDPEPPCGENAFEVKLYAKADDTLLYTDWSGVQCD